MRSLEKKHVGGALESATGRDGGSEGSGTHEVKNSEGVFALTSEIM
jgi:hypothetical protein